MVGRQELNQILVCQWETMEQQGLRKKIMVADQGAREPIGPRRLLRKVPARLHAEVVAKGDVVHGLAALEHQVLPARKTAWPRMRGHVSHRVSSLASIPVHIEKNRLFPFTARAHSVHAQRSKERC